MLASLGSNSVKKDLAVLSCRLGNTTSGFIHRVAVSSIVRVGPPPWSPTPYRCIISALAGGFVPYSDGTHTETSFPSCTGSIPIA